MSIVYIGFELGIHGLDLPTWGETEKFRREVEQHIRDKYASLLDSDVELFINEYAGTVPDQPPEDAERRHVEQPLGRP